MGAGQIRCRAAVVFNHSKTCNWSGSSGAWRRWSAARNADWASATRGKLSFQMLRLAPLVIPTGPNQRQYLGYCLEAPAHLVKQREIRGLRGVRGILPVEATREMVRPVEDIP